MPTRQQLESALVNAHKAGDAKAATALANAIKAGKFDGTDQKQTEVIKNDIPIGDDSAITSDITTRSEQEVVNKENIYRGAVKFQDIDKAFKEIPGGKTLAEFAAGANRSIAGFLDFIGPDNVNAILELAGSDKRVPTFSEMVPERGSFQQGLVGDIAATGGELVPAALSISQGLKKVASNLPKMQAGETAGTGVIRQLGGSRPAQDITAAAAAGAGQEVGREVGGETGAMVGGVLAPIAVAAIPINAAKTEVKKLLSKAAPSVEKIKDTARSIYKSLDESGLSVPAKSFNNLADDIASTLKKEGADEILTPKAVRVVNRLQEDKGLPKTLTELDTLRKIARSAAESQDLSEARLGKIAIQKIDDFMDDIGGEVIQDKTAGEAYRAARGLWQRAKKAEILETAIANARDQASGFENGIRTQYRQILKQINTGKLKGFTDEEVEAIRKTVNGTKAGNVARFLGKFGVMDGVTSRSLTTLSGAGLAGGVGTLAGGTATGGIAAAAVPAIGQVSGALAQRLTINNAKMAQNIAKAGKNWNQIANIYTKNTPKAQQSATELAELFLANKIPVDSVNLKSAKPLISDAALIAAIAKYNDSKEQNQ